MHLPDATAELPPSARCSQRNTLAPAVLKAELRPSKLERQNDAKRGSGHRDDIRLLFVRQRFFLSRQGDASRACHPDRLRGRRRKGEMVPSAVRGILHQRNATRDHENVFCDLGPDRQDHLLFPACSITYATISGPRKTGVKPPRDVRVIGKT